MGKERIRKRGVISDYLPWILIALAVLFILMGAIFLLKGKGTILIERAKNLFRA